MAQGGGISSFGERSPSPVKHPAGDGNAAALDGSFLLQLLQKKPQAPPSSSSHPLIFHESLPPYHDPAVAAIGPGFPFLPHSLFSRPQPTGFSPPSWSPPSFSPPDVANRNLSRGRQFFPMEDQKIGFLPSGASPPNPAPVNCYNGWNSPRSPREGILASNRTKNLGEKHVSNFRVNQEERASIRPPPGFGKAVSVGLDEFTRKMEGDAGSQIASVGSKQQCKPHSYNDGSTSRIEERRGVPSFKKSQRMHSQNSRFESQGGTHWNGRNLDNDDAPNRGLPNGYSAYRQRHRQFAYPDPIMNNCDFMEEKDSGESDKDFVDNEIDEQGLRTFEELICAETGQFSLRNSACSKEDLLGKQLTAALSDNSRKEAKNNSRLGSKDSRMDFFRGHHVSSQRFRIQRRELRSRHDLDSFIPCFLSIFKSLVPSEDEVIKQGQVLKFLRKLVKSEWPDAELHLYGSCANSFGVSNSDIDICLAINDHEISKLDILLKLANILESSNLQNVQALTRARVPIVKMMDPVTGKSCDICINNLLAVVNSKLLKDYAQIDQRLRQLAFIVKHWAKSRRVNETYQGTLSSYAYVLMCIHFLQTRKPAILPCLQGMEATYRVTVDGTECAYFDKVEKLHNFGAQNKESIMQLVWAFFNYWAFHHDYTNQVISVRTGSVISKKEKDWTRRIGNDRHLICIEDPFEVSHDLGRVVDKFSIKVLREEFERAADILQYNLNPSVALFDPYVLGPPSSFVQDETEDLVSLVPAENVI